MTAATLNHLLHNGHAMVRWICNVNQGIKSAQTPFSLSVASRTWMWCATPIDLGGWDAFSAAQARLLGYAIYSRVRTKVYTHVLAMCSPCARDLS